MKGKVTVKCTVLKASSKFASFFKGIIIPLARIAILYHKRAPYSSQKVRKKKELEVLFYQNIYMSFQVSILSFSEIFKD